TLLAGLIEFGQAARASTYNFDQLVFTGPVLQFGNSTDVVAPLGIGSYAFGGEFRQVGDTLQLTNVLIFCLSPQFGQCGAFNVSFEAHNGIGPVGLLAIDLSLAGALDSASGFGRVCIAQGSIICPANLDGPQ